MNRKTWIAVGLFAALVVVTLVKQSAPPERGIERLSFSSLDTGAVDVLEISGQKPAVLKKSKGQWTVEGLGKDADSSLVDRAIKQLAEVNSSDLVTESSERFDEYEVNDEKGVHVVAKAGGKTVADLVLGSSAGGGTNILSDGKVFVVSGIYTSTFSKEADQWLDKRLFRGRKLDDLEKIELTLTDASGFSIAKKDGVWSLPEGFVTPEGFRFDKNAARNFASTLVNLRAREVLVDAPAVDPGLATSKDTFALTFSGGEGGKPATIRVTLGLEVPVPVSEGEEKKPDQVYIAVDTRPDEVVTLSTSQVKNLRRGLERVRDMRVMNLDATKVSALRIQEGNKKLEFEKKDGVWTLTKHSEKKPDGFELDPGAVDRRVRAVANARAARLADGVSARQAEMGRAVLGLTLEDGTSVELRLGKVFKNDSGREEVYVMGNADPLIYVGSSWLNSNLTGGLDKFKKLSQPPGGNALSNIDPKALQNLPPDVRKSLEQQIAQQQAQQRMLQQLQKK